MELAIPYRIERIETNQFAIFPEAYVNGDDVSIDINMSFGINDDLSPLKNVMSVRYLQNDKLLLVLEITCFFSISEDGREAIRKNGKIPVEFLRYMGTFSTGIARGIIHAKTEGTVLNPIILPPVNLNEEIDKGIDLKQKKSKKTE